VFDEAMAAFGKVGAFEEITDGHLGGEPGGVAAASTGITLRRSGRDIRPPSGNLNLEHAPMASLSLAR
jgi:hypothetical protein